MQSLRLDAYRETTASSRTRKVHSSQQVRIHNPHTLGLLAAINVCRESTCNLSDRNPRREKRKKNLTHHTSLACPARSVLTPHCFKGITLPQTSPQHHHHCQRQQQQLELPHRRRHHHQHQRPPLVELLIGLHRAEKREGGVEVGR